ncbi:hypothetical protein [Tenacibaculum sp. 190524A05c]|uniref:Uncharacterized protein n=1 Tax=Tenacibaculum platacis TaxID=3137852 RepID=A0ABP1EXP9_9FLAO
MKFILELINTTNKIIGFTTKEYERELKPVYIKVRNSSQKRMR